MEMDDMEDCSTKDEKPQLKTTPNEIRPSTPPNHITLSPVVLATPKAKYSSVECEGSFLRRIDFHRFNRHRTSTPLDKNGSLCSNTLPNFQHSSTFSGLIDFRHYFSADNGPPKDPEQILSEYVNPFTPDGKLFLNKVNNQKRLKR